MSLSLLLVASRVDLAAGQTLAADQGPDLEAGLPLVACSFVFLHEKQSESTRERNIPHPTVIVRGVKSLSHNLFTGLSVCQLSISEKIPFKIQVATPVASFFFSIIPPPLRPASSDNSSLSSSSSSSDTGEQLLPAPFGSRPLALLHHLFQCPCPCQWDACHSCPLLSAVRFLSPSCPCSPTALQVKAG